MLRKLDHRYRLARMSARNLAKSLDYQEDKLRVRRIPFYQAVETTTQAWLRAKAG